MYLYISGGERAARDLEVLSDKNIKAVVNCTDDLRNYHAGSGNIEYFTFNIAWWRKDVRESKVSTPHLYIGLILVTISIQDDLERFLSPVIGFIERHISSGNNVLVHCLAGAHR